MKCEDEVGTSAVAFDPFADEDDESDEGADVAGTYTDPDNIAALIAEISDVHAFPPRCPMPLRHGEAETLQLNRRLHRA